MQIRTHENLVLVRPCRGIDEHEAAVDDERGAGCPACDRRAKPGDAACNLPCVSRSRDRALRLRVLRRILVLELRHRGGAHPGGRGTTSEPVATASDVELLR